MITRSNPLRSIAALTMAALTGAAVVGIVAGATAQGQAESDVHDVCTAWYGQLPGASPRLFVSGPNMNESGQDALWITDNTSGCEEVVWSVGWPGKVDLDGMEELTEAVQRLSADAPSSPSPAP